MASSSDSSTPRGEPWVWFTGLGLIIGLGMVLGLLTLVILNGVTVFWAPQVPVAQVDDGRTDAPRTAGDNNTLARQLQIEAHGAISSDAIFPRSSVNT